MVYQYALSYAGGLAVEINSSTGRRVRRHTRTYGQNGQKITQTPANVLKFVSKQLRAETRETLFNANHEIDLFGMSFSTPSSYTFGIFINQLPTSATQKLRRVTISGSPDPISSALSPVGFGALPGYAAGFRNFCEFNPQTLVVLKFRGVRDVDSRSWLYKAAALQFVLRGASLLITSRTNHFLPRDQPHISAAFSNTSRMPSNLRFSILDSFPEPDVIRQLQGFTSEQIEILMYQCRRIFDDGI